MHLSSPSRCASSRPSTKPTTTSLSTAGSSARRASGSHSCPSTSPGAQRMRYLAHFSGKTSGMRSPRRALSHCSSLPSAAALPSARSLLTAYAFLMAAALAARVERAGTTVTVSVSDSGIDTAAAGASMVWSPFAPFLILVLVLLLVLFLATVSDRLCGRHGRRGGRRRRRRSHVGQSQGRLKHPVRKIRGTESDRPADPLGRDPGAEYASELDGQPLAEGRR
nr:TPA_asm: m25.5 ORF [Murid betaherpesvirus 1]DBA07751.1 TPA_asm: m25.5 ORF [Murid betaherpesvirus 1]